MTRLMNVANDEFIRTTEPRHIARRQALWQELQRARRNLSRAATPAGIRCATRHYYEES